MDSESKRRLEQALAKIATAPQGSDDGMTALASAIREVWRAGSRHHIARWPECMNDRGIISEKLRFLNDATGVTGWDFGRLANALDNLENRRTGNLLTAEKGKPKTSVYARHPIRVYCIVGSEIERRNLSLDTQSEVEDKRKRNQLRSQLNRFQTVMIAEAVNGEAAGGFDRLERFFKTRTDEELLDDLRHAQRSYEDTRNAN